MSTSKRPPKPATTSMVATARAILPGLIARYPPGIDLPDSRALAEWALALADAFERVVSERA